MGHPALGYNCHLGIAEESTYGTATDPTCFIPVYNESISVKRGWVKRKGARARRGSPKPCPGSITVSGSLGSFEVDADNIGILLKCGLGDVSSAQLGATIAYKHTFKLGSPLIPFTIEANRETQCVQISGCKINSMKFSNNIDQILECSVDIIGKTEAAHAETSPSYSTAMPFNFLDLGAAGVQIGGSANAYVKSFELNVANNLDGNYRTTAEGATIMDLPDGRCEVTGSVTLVFETDEERQRFWGGAAMVENPASVAMDFTFTTAEEIGSTGYYNTIKFIIGSAQYESADANIREDGALEQTVIFNSCETTTTASDDLKVELTNSTPTYS